MTDSPTSQAMHLAMTELKERAERVAELEEALRPFAAICEGSEAWALCSYWIKRARSVLNKETNRV